MDLHDELIERAKQSSAKALQSPGLLGPSQRHLKSHCGLYLGSGVKAGEKIFERFGWKTERNRTLWSLGREQTLIQNIV
jgi:hypothetical protein